MAELPKQVPVSFLQTSTLLLPSGYVAFQCKPSGVVAKSLAGTLAYSNNECDLEAWLEILPYCYLPN